jgi:hypothetical protein
VQLDPDPIVLHRGRRQQRSLLADVAETKRYYNPTSEMYFMQHGKSGHGGTPRAGTDQINAAPIRPLIGNALARLSAGHRTVIRRSYYRRWTTAQIADDLHIAESTVKSVPHFALQALRLALQTQPTRCTLDGPGRQRLRDGVLPSQQAPLAAACDIDRAGAEAHSPGASGIWGR